MTNIVKSPLNYTGSKWKLLPQLLELFPKNINTFYDVFCGGATVAINTPCKHLVVNDTLKPLTDFYKWVADTPYDEILAQIAHAIEAFALSKTNRDGYYRLVQEYNMTRNPCLLYLYACTSFNCTLHINADGALQPTFGRRLFHNPDRLKAMKDAFINGSSVIRNVPFSMLLASMKYSSNDFVYCDPPYLITGASYNKLWTNLDEYALLHDLDWLNKMGVKFGLSNVLHYRGKCNIILKKWAISNKYTVHHLDRDYSNAFIARHSTTCKLVDSDEVFICNF